MSCFIPLQHISKFSLHEANGRRNQGDHLHRTFHDRSSLFYSNLLALEWARYQVEECFLISMHGRFEDIRWLREYWLAKKFDIVVQLKAVTTVVGDSCKRRSPVDLVRRFDYRWASLERGKREAICWTAWCETIFSSLEHISNSRAKRLSSQQNKNLKFKRNSLRGARRIFCLISKKQFSIQPIIAHTGNGESTWRGKRKANVIQSCLLVGIPPEKSMKSGGEMLKRESFKSNSKIKAVNFDLDSVIE